MENDRSQNATSRGPGAADGPGTEGYFARRTFEILRTLILRKIAELSESEQPVSADDVSRLALALSRVEGADRSRSAREQAAGASDIPLIPLNPAYPTESHFVSVNPGASLLIPLCPGKSRLSRQVPLIPAESRLSHPKPTLSRPKPTLSRPKPACPARIPLCLGESHLSRKIPLNSGESR